MDEEDYQPFFAVLSVQPPHSPFVPPTNPDRGAPRIHPSDIQLRHNVPNVPQIRERAALGSRGILRDGGESGL